MLFVVQCVMDICLCVWGWLQVVIVNDKERSLTKEIRFRVLFLRRYRYGRILNIF